MSTWESLLNADTHQVFPWIGARNIVTTTGRSWSIGRRPPEHGWHTFNLSGRKAQWVEAAEIEVSLLSHRTRGYLVGNRFVPDHVRVETDVSKLAAFETVHLIERGLERFTRVVVGRMFSGGPLFYVEMDFPLGPEEDVLRAYEDQTSTLDAIAGVVPALDAAFRFECYQRAETERLRQEAAERRRQEEERIRQEEARLQREAELQEVRGTLEARRIRTLVRTDFAEAVRIALSVGDAEYMDHREGSEPNEYVVRFRMDGRRFECVCDSRLQIVDAGICLTDESTGVNGETWLTLESFPGVIREAIREGRLVVWRHV